MTLKLRNTKMGDHEIEMSNLINILDLKKKYVELLDSKELSKGEIEA